jgi:UrcA family protein
MNTTQYLFPRAKTSIAACAVALMALHSTVSLAADGQQPSEPVLDKRVATISLADLNLATPQGAQAARERLRQTARQLCSRVQDSRDLGHQPHFVACVQEALADALRHVHVPILAAAEGTGGAGHRTP